jgi:glucose/arabinose dehydrogenase
MSTRSRRGLTALVGLALAIGLFGPNTASAEPVKASVVTAAVAAAALPPGYSTTTVDSGYNAPVKVILKSPNTTWATAGERFVAEHGGVVWRTNLATGVKKKLLDISGHVNVYADRGLMSIALDPDYATNHYLYLLYTYENNAAQPSTCKTSTLTRVTVSATGASAETGILGKVHGGGTCSLNQYGEPVGSACPAATTTDCIPSDFWSHSGGDIGFLSDKTMIVTHGDGASYNDVDAPRAYRSQNIDSLAGKVLHVTRAGAGISTNPWWNGTASANRSKVWSRGDRNQFRFKIINGLVIGGNVGWYQREEIQKSIKGGNNGWPCYEGLGKATNGYELTSQCKAMYTANTVVQKPLIADDHNGGGAAIVGGLLVAGTKYPALTGKYLYGDYARDTISYATFDSGFTKVTAGPTVFATAADGPVDFEQASDGTIYYVAISTGEVRQLNYTPGAACAVNQWKMDFFPNTTRSGSPTHTVCLDATGSPNLLQDWGANSPFPTDAAFPKDNFSYRATCSCSFTGGAYPFSGLADDHATVFIDGDYLFEIDNPDPRQPATQPTLTGTHTVVVEGEEGIGEASVNLDWTQTGSQPGLHIAAPLDGSVIAPGSTVNYSADLAIDGNGDPLPPDAVHWSIEKNHCYNPSDCHVHILSTSTGLSGSFLMDSPDPPPDTDFVTVRLSATDPKTGKSQSVTVDLYYGDPGATAAAQIQNVTRLLPPS